MPPNKGNTKWLSYAPTVIVGIWEEFRWFKVIAFTLLSFSWQSVNKTFSTSVPSCWMQQAFEDSIERSQRKRPWMFLRPGLMLILNSERLLATNDKTTCLFLEGALRRTTRLDLPFSVVLGKTSCKSSWIKQPGFKMWALNLNLRHLKMRFPKLACHFEAFSNLFLISTSYAEIERERECI